MSTDSELIYPTYYGFQSYSGYRGESVSVVRGNLRWYLTEVLRGTVTNGAVGTYAFVSYSGNEAADQKHAPSSEGFRSPRPFVHFVTKVASRCNIKCTYCYMYEHADQTWRTQPRLMSSETESAMVDRIGDYLAEREVPEALVILHGGEPLLYGARRIDGFAARVRALQERRANVEMALQTNATMIDEALAEVLVKNRIHVGVSLDGPAGVHDAKRRDGLGRGTHERAVNGLRLLMAASDGKVPPPAVTAVIDPTTRPSELIEHFIDLGIENADFQLPDVNHDTYPYDKWPPGTFGTWLIDLYEELLQIEENFQVRSIELLISLLLGAPFGGDILGRRSFGTLVIDTDGKYHTHDALRASLDGVTATGMTVQSDAIRSLEDHPMVLAFTDKASAASATCRICPVFAVCGGGLVAHRYSTTRGYDNTSVYCSDLSMLIRHVSKSVEQWPRSNPKLSLVEPRTNLP